MTEFVLHSAEAAAERTIEERAMLILSARETQAFVDAILNPAEPGPVLRAAARRFKATLKPASASRCAHNHLSRIRSSRLGITTDRPSLAAFLN